MANIQWVADPMHTEVTFKVKHLMITTVTGYFKKFNVTAETETDDFHTLKTVEFTAEVDSIDTNNEQRDTHLKSADFFDAASNPHIRFVGNKYETQGSHAKLHGELTIRETTRPITLDVEYGGMVVDPYGQTKAGFTVTGKISRKEFGLQWNAVTEAGSVVVSDEIKMFAEVQLIKQS